MKIALDCRAVFKGMGGIGRYAWNLVKELSLHDKENDYICYFTHLAPPESIRLPDRFRIRVFQAGMIDERFDQLILPTLLAAENVDVYHNPTFAAPVVRTRTKTVSTIHDVVFRRHPELVEQGLREYLHRATLRACKQADHLITVSEFSRKEIKALYPEASGDITVIHNGVKAPRAGTTERLFNVSSLGLEKSEYVLYVGSIEAKKNIDTLLRAFGGLTAGGAHSTLQLALVGSMNGSSYPLERQIKTFGLEGRVRYLGYVAEDILEALYSSAGIFVYPSLYEGFGFPPLEAMVRGVPTIVSDASSLPEVVGDGAILFDPSSAETLTKAMKELVADRDRQKELSERGRQRALEFTWKRCAERHLEVYEAVARTHEAAPSGI